MFEPEMSTSVTLLNGTYDKYAELINRSSLQRLDDLYAHYHRQWWCQREMFQHFQRCHSFLNGMALLVFVFWKSLIGQGTECGGRHRVGKQFCHGRLDNLRYFGERLE